jgi:hypothetical protein
MTLNLIFKSFRWILDFFLDFWIPVVLVLAFCFFTGIPVWHFAAVSFGVLAECTKDCVQFLTDPSSLEKVREWMRFMIF